MGQKRKGAAVSPPPVIRDWTEADAVLRGVAECRAALAGIAADCETSVEGLKAHAREKASPYGERLKAGLAALEDFTRAHEADLEGRSKKLTHGVVGLRQTTAIMLKRSAKYCLDALRAKGMFTCIRVKEEIDKTALEPCGDDVLDSVGCRRMVRDVFYATTDEVRL